MHKTLFWLRFIKVGWNIKYITYRHILFLGFKAVSYMQQLAEKSLSIVCLFWKGFWKANFVAGSVLGGYQRWGRYGCSSRRVKVKVPEKPCDRVSGASAGKAAAAVCAAAAAAPPCNPSRRPTSSCSSGCRGSRCCRAVDPDLSSWQPFTPQKRRCRYC